MNFDEEVKARISALGENVELRRTSREFMDRSVEAGYSYNFKWLGRPIIQYPQDIVAVQELIWQVKPDLIIETGIARGGSLIFSASMLAMLDTCDAIEASMAMDPTNSKRKVLGIDIDIREHNKQAIEHHPMSCYIQMIQGSSIADDVIKAVVDVASEYDRVMVLLDSNHTHEHVLAELHAYAHLVTPGSYCVVYDTIVEDLSNELFPDRPWSQGNNPKTAVWEFLEHSAEFEIDKGIQDKLQISVAPDGFLKRIGD